MNPPVILIVEDDDLQFEIYEEALAKYKLVRVKNGSEALAQIPRQPAGCAHPRPRAVGRRTRTGFSARVQGTAAARARHHRVRRAGGAPADGGACRARAARTTACPSRWTSTPSGAPWKPRCRNAAKPRWSGSLKRWNVRTAWTRRNCSAAPPTASPARTTSSNCWGNPGTPEHLRARPRIQGGPPHHHPRPAGIDPPRPAQAGGLSRMGESTAGRPPRSAFFNSTA
jgi:CheY-like chemotaxis protein